ncbi:MAG: hypothetical protein O6924_12020, partial [Alphaproteobacteria bacterium]|nr:hypothetical protein [Alphaproteobacteria bacterium]
MAIPDMPDMTENEIRKGAEKLLGQGLRDKDYGEIVKVLTVANYAADLCVRVLGDRDQLDWIGDMPVIPDARPETLEVDNVLIGR